MSYILTDTQGAAAGDPVAALFVGLRGIVAAAWPEVVGAGILEAEHADMIPWSQLSSNRAVISIGAMTATTDWGSTLDTYLATVEIFYLVQVGGPLSQIRAKLMTLRRAINRAGTIETVQGANAAMDWSDMMRVNAVLQSEESTIRAGVLRFVAVVSEPYILS